MSNEAPWRVFTHRGRAAHREGSARNGLTFCNFLIDRGRREDARLREAPMCYRCEKAWKEEA
jgi:hypothetical protein